MVPDRPNSSSRRPDAAFRLGAQFYINRHDPPELVADGIARMAEEGLSLVRVFLSWDHLEPREGRWNWAAYDAVFATAARHGMRVVGTLMAVSPPGWMRVSEGLQDVGNLDDPNYWRAALAYAGRVVERWRDAPALDSWILWNEPARSLQPTPETKQAFRAFLFAKYEGEIERLNHVHYGQYTDFTEVLAEGPTGVFGLGFGSRGREIDWIEFTVHHLMVKLRDLAGVVRERDPVHPIHLNPHRVSQCLLDSGQSLGREAEIADFMGFSAHPPWHSVRFPEDRIAQSVAMFADLTRSVTRASSGRFWCTELQGGPTLFSAFRPSSPSADEITRWIWECAASGAEAVIFWCFNTRQDGYEAGEWSLCLADGKASDRLVRSVRAAAQIADLGSWIAPAPPVPEVWILNPEAGLLLGLVEGEGDAVSNPRNRQMSADAVCGAYLMASDLGYECGFADEQRVSEGIPDSVKVLVAPGCLTLSLSALATISAWVRRGGMFLADGLLAWKTPTGALDHEAQEAAGILCGGLVRDYVILNDEPFTLEGGPTAAGWFLRLRLELIPGSTSAARWQDGEVAITRHRIGRGEALRLGTVFFQHYLGHPDPSSLDVLRRLLGADRRPAVRLANPEPGLRLRRKVTDVGTLGVILSTLGTDRAEIVFDAGGTLGTPGQRASRVLPGGSALITLDASGVGCFTFTPTTASSPSLSLPSEPATLIS